MKFSPLRVNAFLLLKLPSAWLCGVRLKSIDENNAVVTVRYRWINQNPFRSMYFAVQAMAAELSTGALVLKAIKEQGEVSMLVASCRASFYKKAVGKITFQCNDGNSVRNAITQTLTSGEPVSITMTSTGTNEVGETVSVMGFEWTLKARNKR